MDYALISILAIICETIDSGLGMGYGTILSPLLIMLGFKPTIVVPSILFSQAIGGLIGAISHHKNGNAHFGKKTEDTKSVIAITSLGMLATIIGSFLAISIPKIYLNTYIGIMVFVIGVMLLLGIKFRYTIKRIIGVGLISAFNKGLSGGGYGPIVTGGQMVLGKEQKNSIGCTTAAEVPICIVGFIMFVLFKEMTSWNLLVSLAIGAVIGGFLGPIITKKIDKRLLKLTVGILITVLGGLLLLQIVGIIPIKISI